MMETQEDKNRLLNSFIAAVVPVLYLWIVKLVEIKFSFDFSDYGVYPRQWTGLSGILLSPFIHADFYHLFSNTVPLLLLGTGIRYFYKEVFFKVYLLVFLLSGICVWIFARPAYHIGASGVAYGLAGFLFFSGLFRKEPKLMGLSLLVVFLYGSMLWGVFPIYADISWEAHLSGALTGLLAAFVFRKIGPQRQEYEWEHEEEQDENRLYTEEDNDNPDQEETKDERGDPIN